MATPKKKEDPKKATESKSVMKKKEVKPKVASFMAIKAANEIEHLATADNLKPEELLTLPTAHQYIANLRSMHEVKSYSVQKLLNAVKDKATFTSSLDEKIHKLYTNALNMELKKRKVG
jgi:hypothetical protein